jgi:hypothetical protein
MIFDMKEASERATRLSIIIKKSEKFGLKRIFSKVKLIFGSVKRKDAF